MSAVTRSEIHTYLRTSVINFFLLDTGELSVHIDTKRLHIRSVEATQAEYDRFSLLFGDKNVTEKFADGPVAREEIEKRIRDKWVKRWQANDPCSGFAVHERTTGEFLGSVVLHLAAPGESEIGYLFHQAHWNKGYGSEAVRALVQEYVPATVKEGYTFKGKPLERITATARIDNPGSSGILEKVGMHLDKVAQREGAKDTTARRYYSILLTELQKINATL